QPSHGPAQAHGSGGPRRPARDRGVPAPDTQGAAVRASADPARQGGEGGAGKEGGKGVLQLERLRGFHMPQALSSPLSTQGPEQILGPAVCVAMAVWSS